MSTLYFVTPYKAVQFNVSPETLLEPLSVSTPVGDQVIARRVYKNCPVTVSKNVTSADLVELEMIDFDVILAWIGYTHAMPLSIVELGMFVFSVFRRTNLRVEG